jgi:hypothetical protein
MPQLRRVIRMAGMGPTPKPDAQRRRRNATVATTKLPANGRQGRAPKWPLIPDIATKAKRDLYVGKVAKFTADLETAIDMGLPTYGAERRLADAELELAICEARLLEQRKIEALVWRELWKTPAAAQWEKLGWTRELALYVRWQVLGELGDLDAAKEARQWSDRLGLTPLAMLRMRWDVAADEVGERRQEKSTAAAAAARPSAQSRMRVVDPHVAGA